MLRDTEATDVILIGTGAEVQVALEAAEELSDKDGLNARVVSMPCWDRFAEADQSYRDQVLPPAMQRARVDRGRGHAGLGEVGRRRRRVAGHDRLRRLGPAKELFEHFGLTSEHLAEVARRTHRSIQEA